MLTIRMVLPNTGEIVYPETYEPEDLCTFWGVVRGYQLRETPYEIEQGSGVMDRNDFEIFQGDVVHMIHKSTDDRGIIHTEIDDVGVVDFFEGAFFIVTDKGDVIDLGPGFETPNQVNEIRIVRHRLEEAVAI